MSNSAVVASDYLLNPTKTPEDKFIHLSNSINLGWRLKEEFSGIHKNRSKIEEMINEFRSLGATAGRLCGAGGSGFILLLSEIGERQELLEKLKKYNAFPIEVTKKGSEIILNEPDVYSSLGVVN
jgi:D-glycero-alpha-D-manno-heptose-7-phosphate kinase